MQLDLPGVAGFIESAYPASITGNIGVMALLEGRPTHRSFARSDVSSLLEFVEELDRGSGSTPAAQGIYLRVTTVRPDLEPGRRGGVDDSVEFLGFWGDVDFEGPGHKPLPAGSLPLPPDTAGAIRVVTESGLPEVSLWVHSGGGIYPHTLLTEPYDIRNAERREEISRMSVWWQGRLVQSAARLGHFYGSSVHDLARVLRCPFSVNRKLPDDPKMCRVLDISGPRYNIEELLEVFRSDTSGNAGRAISTPAASKTRKPVATSDPATAASPFDDLQEKVSWAEILEPQGWTIDKNRSRGRTSYWIRPGKNASEGHSATTGHADDKDRLFVFSDATGLPVSTPMSKAYVWAHYNTDGDLRAAAKELAGQGFGTAIWTPTEEDLTFTPEVEVSPPQCLEPTTLSEVHAVFTRWLGTEYDLEALDAILATAAVDQLDGDPVWSMIVSGSGSGKTESVACLAGAGALVISTISSEGALLSATSKRDKSKEATGGLLRQMGDHGVLVAKDFSSTLSQNRDQRASVLAALREVYDGAWMRAVGVDGGKTIEWKGRLILIGAVTSAIDAAHHVIAQMGDRFMLIRMSSSRPEARRVSGWQALRNVGHEREMRSDLMAIVGRLMASLKLENATLGDAERERLFPVADLVTRARTAVERDYRGDPEWAYEPEAPQRMVKGLGQLVRGGIAIGMSRKDALEMAVRVGRDSMPPIRLDVLADVAANPGTTTTDCARRLQRPRQTTDRALQELQLLNLIQVDRKPSFSAAQSASTGWLWRLSPDVPFDALGYMATPQSVYEAPDPFVVAPIPLVQPTQTLPCACPNAHHDIHRDGCLIAPATAGAR